MNKEYICFKNLTLVEENNGELLIREQPKNVDEVLKIENEIELLKKIISDDKDMKNKLKKRINYLKKSSDSTYRIIYGVLAIYFLVTTSIVASLICLGLGEGIFGIKKLIVRELSIQSQRLYKSMCRYSQVNIRTKQEP